MKIASANLQMASTHLATQEHQVRESLRMWVGARRPDPDPGTPAPPRPAAPPVQISQAARQAQELEAREAAGPDTSGDPADKDPKIFLIRSVVEMLTGRKIRVFNPEALKQAPAPDAGGPPPAPSAAQAGNGNRPAGYGVEYDYHESYAETEQTTFAAQGVVKTEDGREIAFQLQLSMSRSYYEESSVSIRLGDAVVKDPLVLNFNGKAAELSDTRFQFDLDADGRQDSIHFVGSGSGFLALDRNGDGRINDGGELFGALTGDGFRELAALDGDANGWIDENDPAFQDLRVWRQDEQGRQRLDSLQTANVGAISLAQVSTPFALKDSGNQLQGLIRSTGVFLQETGGAGTIQKLDLVV